jgi:hypothetical protein
LTGNYGGKLTNRVEGPRYDGQVLLNMCGCRIRRRLFGIIRENRVFDRIWVARDGVPFWRRFIVYFSFVGERGRNDSSVARVERPSNRSCAFRNGGSVESDETRIPLERSVQVGVSGVPFRKSSVRDGVDFSGNREIAYPLRRPFSKIFRLTEAERRENETAIFLFEGKLYKDVGC